MFSRKPLDKKTPLALGQCYICTLSQQFCAWQSTVSTLLVTSFMRVYVTRQPAIYLLKKLKLFSHQLNSKLCYLRLYVSIETVSCRLLLRMARIYNDMKLKKFGQLSQVLIILGAPKENVVQNHINIALLNVF